MNFAADRDLLVQEPNLFIDLPFVAQQRVHANDGGVEGTTLQSASSDFVVAGVESGFVVLLAGKAHEVIERVDANTLTISQLRSRANAAPLAAEPGENIAMQVRTFQPQITLMHESLLRVLGIDVDDPSSGLSEDAVLSMGVMARLETLAALEQIYAAGAALVGDNQMLRVKAASYRSRFRAACARATVLIDANGDGIAEQRTRPGAPKLIRV